MGLPSSKDLYDKGDCIKAATLPAKAPLARAADLSVNLPLASLVNVVVDSLASVSIPASILKAAANSFKTALNSPSAPCNHSARVA